MKSIDLRSDTVTKPTPEMRQAMAEAEVGDDVYGEDPTVNRLEALAAEMMNKEAALFVPTGSMGNQIALMLHCQRGDEAICDREAHIFHYEMAAPAVLAGVQMHTVEKLHRDEGIAALSGHIREQAYDLPRTKLICLENTLNRGGGSVMKQEQMAAVHRLAKSNGLKVHLDGARIFNAALALGCEVTDLTSHADSVMFCFSKGLGAPVGSALVGDRDFITEARRCRKLLGGGMRQAGVLAAAALVALRNTSRLAEDHEKAKVLAEGLSVLPGVRVDIARVETNMVLCTPDESCFTKTEFVKKIAEVGVLAGAVGRSDVRFVTHSDVSMDDVKDAIDRLKQKLS